MMTSKQTMTLVFRRLALLVLLLLAGATDSGGAEHVVFEQNGTEKTAIGSVIVEAQDGGLLLEGNDQVVWALQPDQIKSREPVSETQVLGVTELKQAINQELGDGFQVHCTKHYLIFYNTSRDYAYWCGALFERLHFAFTNYWERKGIEMTDTPPLIACVFRDEASYRAYAKQELGDAVQSILGYYSYHTNRIVMYNLLGGTQSNERKINELFLRQERTIATIIHEATHQLAFNCGLHQRFADIPLWLSEGMAIYFETPDLQSRRGWRTIGAENQVQLSQFRNYAKRRHAQSLVTLLQSDARFQDNELAADAYAEAWAFCYFLIRQYEGEMVGYLKMLQQRKPLKTVSTVQRLQEFETAFGKSVTEMDREFMAAMGKL